MLVREDMLPAIAALSRTLGTVAEIHLRVALIGDTADRAAMERSRVPQGALPSLLRQLPPAAFHHPY